MADKNRTLKIDVKLDNRDVKKKTKDTKKQLDDIGSSAKSLGPLIAGAFGTAALVGFGKAVLDTAREFERLETMLKTATGSAKNAAIAFDGIKKFATETPFTVAQVTEAFIKLKNLGLDPSMESLEAYGNIASSMGKDVMQFVEAVADASVGEFERLKEFGIKASKEGENISFRFKGVSTTVKNTSEDIQAFLKGIGENDFAGAMTDQMNTMNGAISNAGVAFDNMADAIGDKIGPTVIELANAFAIAADQLRALISPNVQDEINDLNQELQAQLDLLVEAEDPWTGNSKAVAFHEERIAALREEIKKLTATETERAAEFKKIQQGQAPGSTVTAAVTGIAATQEMGPLAALAQAEQQQILDIHAASAVGIIDSWHSTEIQKTLIAQHGADARAAIRQTEITDAEAMTMIFGNLQALAASGSKKAFEVSKAAGIAEAIVGTYSGATKAFQEVSYPLNFVASASIIAAGLANVQKIKNTKFGSGAGGGSSPSGASGGSPSNQFGTAPVIQPATEAGISSGPEIKVISGNTLLGKMVEEEVIPAINDALRRGVSLDLEFA